ncbi:MAG: type II secretion system major pseudopilin GspG [Desulfobacterales bacterium]|nr:type II secretion system major pseudopilin GspG [Desulfobacterales bacterium]
MDKSRKRKHGFTLIEVLIVMVILGLLGALVAPRMFGKVGKSRQRAAKAQISLFETALDTYRLDVGKYPGTLEGLRTDPGGTNRWDGPYLPKDVPMDPWGNPYEYRMPGEHGDFEITSLGADGGPGGEGEDKDIVNWKGIDD